MVSPGQRRENPMGYLLLYILAFVGLILQATLLSHFTVAGVKPDIILILAVFYSVLSGPKKGLFCGFSLGLLEDLYWGRFIGMNALSKGITAAFVGWIAEGAFCENLLVPIISVFVGTLFNQIIVFALGKVMGLNWYFQLWIWKTIPLALYNTCLVPFIYSYYYYWTTKKTQKSASTKTGKFL